MQYEDEIKTSFASSPSSLSQPDDEDVQYNLYIEQHHHFTRGGVGLHEIMRCLRIIKTVFEDCVNHYFDLICKSEKICKR